MFLFIFAEKYGKIRFFGIYVKTKWAQHSAGMRRAISRVFTIDGRSGRGSGARYFGAQIVDAPATLLGLGASIVALDSLEFSGYVVALWNVFGVRTKCPRSSCRCESKLLASGRFTGHAPSSAGRLATSLRTARTFKVIGTPGSSVRTHVLFNKRWAS